MKKFFTQPVGQLARQNCIGFIGCNLYLIGNGFGLYEGPCLLYTSDAADE